MYGYLVFPTPGHLFDEMVRACAQLQGYYGTEHVPVQLLSVITMKRGYLFENSKGEYGEFQPGDRFLFFGGRSEKADEALFFNGLFPTEAVQNACNWEGHPYKTNILQVDNTLRNDMRTKMIGFNRCTPWVENRWVIQESLEHYLGTHGLRDFTVYG